MQTSLSQTLGPPRPRFLSKARRSLMLTRPEQVLASGRSRPTKLRCSDFWSRSMKKEAVRILWAKNDALADRNKFKTQVLPQSHSEEEGKVSKRLSHYIQRVRSIEISTPDWQLDHSLSHVERIRLCDNLQSEVHSELMRLRTNLMQSKRSTPQLLKSLSGEETDLAEFIKGEVADFKKGPQKPELLRKLSGGSIVKRMNRLGLSFYVAQRKKPFA